MVDSGSGQISNRSNFTTQDTIAHLWSQLGLPTEALSSLNIPDSNGSFSPSLPSSFKIGHLAQSTIALSALTAALFHSIRNKTSVPKVTVPLLHACLEFQSEKIYTLAGKKAKLTGGLGSIGTFHKTSDGYVRIHDGFPHHLAGSLSIIGQPVTATKSDIESVLLNWNSVELEATAIKASCVIAALRTYEQWDALPQAKAISNSPIQLNKVCPGSPGLPPRIAAGNDCCLRGVRVLELSRVIAAPVAGRTLAAHGADVLWVTSSSLPDLPGLDRDLARGKRTAQLDLTSEEGREKLLKLVKDADVFIQGYRPGSLASKGFSALELAKINSNLVYANMSAYGPDGPWNGNRGFDSIVQTCSGMNISEAEHFGEGEPARPMPCQALDHASGYLLAAGIGAALCKRATEGGSYEVNVSLAGTMKYLRSLGQFDGRTGFYCRMPGEEEVEGYLEVRMSEFGELKALKHSASVEGAITGWDIMPKRLGSDRPEWL